MGYDASAVLMFGVLANRDEFYEIKNYPGCDHEHSGKFCPECGAPATEASTEPIDGWDEGGNFRGLEFCCQDCDSGDGVLGVELCSTAWTRSDGEKIVACPEGREDIARVEQALKQTKFKDRETKLYLVLYESY